MGKKTVLIITDGIGHNPSCEANAFCNAKKPTYETLFQTTPHSLIHTYGLHVGLPDGQMGNSEVGHMAIGSGRVLYQDLVKISLAIEDGSIEQNRVFTDILVGSKAIHLIGLMSDGGVHSHLSHILSIAQIAAGHGKRVYLHLITDGRDVSPTSAPTYLAEVEAILSDTITIATLSGRFYTMDRDKREERIQAGFDEIVNALHHTALSPLEYVEASYATNETDEFIKPISFAGYNGMQAGDGVLFCNFRSDRMRQIVTKIGSVADIHIATMTEYDARFTYPILFTKENPVDTLSEVISRANLRQYHVSETEKYAHVTFFFNGGVEEPYTGETRDLIASPKVRTYDEAPAMSAVAIGASIKKAINEGYDFIVANFANGDMVGHTGNFDAAVIGVETVDGELGKIVQLCDEYDYNLVITSDHGNCEMMRDADGNILTNHTVGDVWCFVRAHGVEKIENGGLDNIAPTILKLMGLPIPSQMSKALF